MQKTETGYAMNQEEFRATVGMVLEMALEYAGYDWDRKLEAEVIRPAVASIGYRPLVDEGFLADIAYRVPGTDVTATVAEEVWILERCCKEDQMTGTEVDLLDMLAVLEEGGSNLDFSDLVAWVICPECGMPCFPGHANCADLDCHTQLHSDSEVVLTDVGVEIYGDVQMTKNDALGQSRSGKFAEAVRKLERI
jgi:hypothetical protein